ncbi:NnrU family protein [Rhizobium sp. KVB221]|uniref:NnrU family protein n=1 Tax=Rhizobium setariae TaxID=2801340 RepID=A0A936YUM4_9HYPH|nr:NnrU family protein [Rhizobium setariae]MBL0373561.1 NnrU family protein [Rhizobium setariae]
MSGLLLAFLIFVALHSIPAIPRLRNGLIRLLGRGPYLAAYSLVSLAAIGWLFHEAMNTDYIELWQPSAWQSWITFVFAPLGLFFVLTGLFSVNPFSVTLRRDGEEIGAIVRITRHPVLWGFFFWSLGHVFPNGDLRSLILFGGFALFSLAGIVLQERRSRKRLRSRWAVAIDGTSIVPFAKVFGNPRSLRWDVPIVVGLLTTLTVVIWLLVGAHLAFFGVDPLMASAI